MHPILDEIHIKKNSIFAIIIDNGGISDNSHTKCLKLPKVIESQKIHFPIVISTCQFSIENDLT